MDEVLATLGSIWNMIVQFLGEFLDLTWFGPFVFCAVFAVILNPRGPSQANNLIWSVIFATPMVLFLALMLRLSPVDATIFALLTLAAGMVWIFMDTSWGRNKLGKIAAGVLVVISFGAVIGTAAASPGAGIMPGVLNQTWAAMMTLKDHLFGGV